MSAMFPLFVQEELQNEAVVFLKPHADNDKAEKVVVAGLEAAGCTVAKRFRISGPMVEEKKLIDQHYGSLATAAMGAPPSTLSPDKAVAFSDMFGVEYSAARTALNPVIMAELQVDGLELETMWRAGPCLKLSPGVYVAKLVGAACGDVYTINGFYPAMRQEFVADAATVRVLVVTWLPSVLSWQQFRDVVIGPTDPSTASPKSLRGKFRTHWHSLGLAREPAISCNCVHASAGPLEGLKEREVWAGASVADDPLGRRLVAKLSNPFTQPPRDGAAVLRSWLDTNPVYQLGAGDAKKIFDATEGMDARELLDALPNPPGRVAA